MKTLHSGCIMHAKHPSLSHCHNAAHTSKENSFQILPTNSSKADTTSNCTVFKQVESTKCPEQKVQPTHFQREQERKGEHKSVLWFITSMFSLFFSSSLEFIFVSEAGILWLGSCCLVEKWQIVAGFQEKKYRRDKIIFQQKQEPSHIEQLEIVVSRNSAKIQKES